MALLETLSDDERQRLLGSSAPGAGVTSLPPASSPSEAAPAPASSGFTSLADYFGANKEAAGQLADKVSGGLRESALDALNQDDLTAAQGTLADINAAASGPGLSAVLEKQSGAGYTGGLGRLDAYLANRAGGEQFAGLRDYFGKPLAGVEAPPPVPGESPGAAPVAPSPYPSAANLAGAAAGLVAGDPNAQPQSPAQPGPLGTNYTNIKYAMAYPGKKQEYAAAASDWQKKQDEYNKQLDEYNAWVERRNANVGDIVAPKEKYPKNK